MKINVFQSLCAASLLFMVGNMYAYPLENMPLQFSAPVVAEDSVVISDTISRQVSDSTIPANKVNQNEERAYIVVEQGPEFQGGETALMAYIRENLKYPAHAAKKGIQGRVSISFIIEKDGSISNIKVFSTSAEELNQEAIRLVNAMPRWKPGMQEGKPVRVKYVLPITFRLGNSR